MAEVVRVKLEIPQLQSETYLNLNLDETIWNLKNDVIKTIAQELKEFLNLGFYIPSSATKAAKYLDEERTLREYNLSEDSVMQFISKKRIYKAAALNTKKLKEINKKVFRKKITGYIEYGSLKKVKELLDKGLDPNFIDPESGECPLTLSVTSKFSSQMITNLVGGGAHLDYRNNKGWTAVHKAAKHGNLEAIKTLLDFGASPNYRDLDGLTPLYAAVCHDTPPDCIKQLLKDYAILGITDAEGNSEIHQVCKNGRVQHLDLLITYGADMNSVNLSGNTPLHICAMKNQEECARLLLFRGADKYIKNSLNQSAQDLASFYKNDKLKEVIESHTPRDVVISNELPTYNEKSRLTLKRSDRNSLLLSKMNKLSLSTPYLHQSVTNINWECATKLCNDCSSVKSNNSENHSTGSADQQFEFDADVTPTHESRPSSMPNNSQSTMKSLKYVTVKSQPMKSLSVEANKKTSFFKRPSSSDILSQLDSGFHEVPLRRQSYGDVLGAHADDIYMNDWEIERKMNEEQMNSKYENTRRTSADVSKSKDVNVAVMPEKPPNIFSSSVNSNCSTLDEDTHFNSTEPTRLCFKPVTSFQTPHRVTSKIVPANSTAPKDHVTTLPTKPRPELSSTKSPPQTFSTLKSSENQNSSSSNQKAHGIKSCFQNETQATSFSKPSFTFIPPPPIFPSSFKASTLSTKKMNSLCGPPVSPPPPPPPADYSSTSYSPNYPLPPPPVIRHQAKTVSANDGQAELLAAIMKRRDVLEQN